MYVARNNLQPCAICRTPLTVDEQAVGEVCGRRACQEDRLKRERDKIARLGAWCMLGLFPGIQRAESDDGSTAEFGA